jgi:hypothetical protein
MGRDHGDDPRRGRGLAVLAARQACKIVPPNQPYAEAVRPTPWHSRMTSAPGRWPARLPLAETKTSGARLGDRAPRPRRPADQAALSDPLTPRTQTPPLADGPVAMPALADRLKYPPTTAWAQGMRQIPQCAGSQERGANRRRGAVRVRLPRSQPCGQSASFLHRIERTSSPLCRVGDARKSRSEDVSSPFRRREPCQAALND